MVIVHDRILRYVEMDIIEDEYGVIQQVSYDTKGLGTPVEVSEGTYILVVKQNDTEIVKSTFQGPWKGYILSEYINKPPIERLPVISVEKIPYGYAKYIITSPSKPYLVIARGDASKTIRVIATKKEWIFNPLDINNDGKGFRGIFIQGEKIYGEGVWIEHNGLDVLLFKLMSDLNKNIFNATIEIYKVG